MPHWFEKEKLKIPVDKDRRYKLSPEERNHVKELIAYGATIEYVARMYKVARATIKMIVDDDYREQVYAKKRGKWREYYNKERHAQNIKSYRHYKKKVLEESNEKVN